MPIYAEDVNLEVAVLPAQDIENPGQIYTLGDLLLINEIGKGIHIVDNADPTNPTNEGFLRVAGSENMVLRNSVLYVNQFQTLLSIDVTDIQNVQVLSRDVLALQNGSNNQVPPEVGVYFECPDPSKGEIVGWALTTINNPKCYR